MEHSHQPHIYALREQIARMQATSVQHEVLAVQPFGIPAIDSLLPGHGIALGALHEAAGVGPETEHAAAAALFVAGILVRCRGIVLWVLEQPDLFAPALAGVGLPLSRVIFLEAGRNVLAGMEDGLRPGWSRRRGG